MTLHTDINFILVQLMINMVQSDLKIAPQQIVSNCLPFLDDISANVPYMF